MSPHNHYHCFCTYAAYEDTEQTDAPSVMWNGEDVSGGGTLSICHASTRCTLRCSATSDFSPTFYVNGVCYAVTTLSEKFIGSVVDREHHPHYTFTFDCAVVTRFRCVYSESSYSPEFTLEENAGRLFPFLHCTFLIVVRRPQF